MSCVPVVADCLLGDALTIRVATLDADGEPVTPTEIVARVGVVGREPETVAVDVDRDGLASFEVAPSSSGTWAWQVNVTAPVEAAQHGLVRVHEPVFGGLDG